MFSTIALVIVGCMPLFFGILIDQSYAEAYKYIPLLMISAIFSVFINLLTSLYIAFKETKKLATTAVLAGIINTAANVILINKIGIYAAPVSTIIAFGIMGAYRYIEIRKYIKLELEIKKFFIVALCFLIVIALYFSGNIILKVIGFAFSLIVFCYMNKKYICNSFNLLKKKININV